MRGDDPTLILRLIQGERKGASCAGPRRHTDREHSKVGYILLARRSSPPTGGATHDIASREVRGTGTVPPASSHVLAYGLFPRAIHATA